jgi:hypothetical protein
MTNVSTQTCRACGKPFASEMTYCPHCNANVPGAKQKDSHLGTILIVVMIAGCLIGVALKFAGYL